MTRPTLANSGSVFRYGLHRALLLVDGIGKTELADAHDPRPRQSSSRPVPGDPFHEPSRPLLLTLASDCSHLSPLILRGLVSLSRYPGIQVAMMPGIDRCNYREPYVIGWAEDVDVLSISAEQAESHPKRSYFRHGAVSLPIVSHRTESTVFFDRGLDAHASTVFPDASDSARQLVREAQVHAGLGYDYVVSPGMASARIDRSMRWPNDLGACTPYEAFRLAGVKARMYDSVPLFADPDALFSVNVGMWYDLAVMHFTPGLVRAIGGALTPGAAHDEHLVGEHLLAIRVRLSELLQARDAIYRLTRREALGPLRGSTFAEGPIVGPRGNDLTAQMSYHLTAALDSAFAAIDNAVWVVVRGDDPAKSRGSVGLGTLLDPKPSAWTRRPGATTAIRLLARNSSLPFTLAARALRNNMVHREGLDFGTIDWHPSADAPVHGLSGIWVTRDQLPPLELSIGRVDLFGGLAHSGRLCGQDMVVMTYQRFVDGLWDSTTRTVGSCLSAREWSSRGWTWSDPVVMNAPREWHLWRTPMQRRLWGL